MKLTNADSPCPIPAGFKEAPPFKENNEDKVTSPAYWPVGTKGGHLEDATDEFYNSIWNVPDGRRKG